MIAVLKGIDMADEGTNTESRIGALEADGRHIRSDIGEIKTEMRRLGDRFEAMRSEFSAELKAVHSELSAELKAMRSEFAAEMRALRSEFSGEIKGIHSEQKSIRDSIASMRVWA